MSGVTPVSSSDSKDASVSAISSCSSTAPEMIAEEALGRLLVADGVPDMRRPSGGVPGVPERAPKLPSDTGLEARGDETVVDGIGIE